MCRRVQVAGAASSSPGQAPAEWRRESGRFKGGSGCTAAFARHGFEITSLDEPVAPQAPAPSAPTFMRRSSRRIAARCWRWGLRQRVGPAGISPDHPGPGGGRWHFAPSIVLPGDVCSVRWDAKGPDIWVKGRQQSRPSRDAAFPAPDVDLVWPCPAEAGNSGGPALTAGRHDAKRAPVWGAARSAGQHGHGNAQPTPPGYAGGYAARAAASSSTGDGAWVQQILHCGSWGRRSRRGSPRHLIWRDGAVRPKARPPCGRAVLQGRPAGSRT